VHLKPACALLFLFGRPLDDDRHIGMLSRHGVDNYLACVSSAGSRCSNWNLLNGAAAPSLFFLGGVGSPSRPRWIERTRYANCGSAMWLNVQDASLRAVLRPTGRPGFEEHLPLDVRLSRLHVG
jgi:hypothetical protein